MQSAQFSLNFRLEQTHWWFVARRSIIQRLVACLVPPNRSACIVDVGCGTGANVGCLNDNYTCVGIDASSEAINLARSRYPNVRFICGDAFDCFKDLAPETDLVMLTDVLEHVSNDRAIFSDLIAAACPGTYFLMTVPADPSLWSFHDRSHGHYRRYDRHLLQRLWEGLPVTQMLISYFNSRLYPIVKLARILGRLRGKPIGEAGTDLRMPAGPLNWALERVFRGEGSTLVDLLAGSRKHPYQHGVSLIAILRRENSAGSRRLPLESTVLRAPQNRQKDRTDLRHLDSPGGRPAAA